MSDLTSSDQDRRDGTMPDDSVISQVQAIIAQSTHAHYTNRPDLVLKELERICPGAVQSMLDKTIAAASRDEEARFHFGKIQAYIALFLQTVGGVASIALAFYCVAQGEVFSGIIASAIFYAITQGGMSGFSAIIQSIGVWMGSKKNGKE
jgi:hypothetical protein